MPERCVCVSPASVGSQAEGRNWRGKEPHGGCQTRKPGGGRTSPHAMVGLSFKMLQECKVSFRRNKTRTNTQSRAGQEWGGEGELGEDQRTSGLPQTYKMCASVRRAHACVLAWLPVRCILSHAACLRSVYKLLLLLVMYGNPCVSVAEMCLTPAPAPAPALSLTLTWALALTESGTAQRFQQD